MDKLKIAFFDGLFGTSEGHSEETWMEMCKDKIRELPEYKGKDPHTVLMDYLVAKYQVNI